MTLPTIPGGWTKRDFVLAGQTLRVTLPASPDAFLDDPDVLAANRRDDYMPYWSYLWPTSLETAVAVLTHDWSRTSLPVRKGGPGGVGSTANQSPTLVCNESPSSNKPTASRDACLTPPDPPLGREGKAGQDPVGPGSPSCDKIEALEIGAGIALTGLAALSRGLRVTFSDYDRRAIDLALFNARENRLDRNAAGLLLDWRHPIDRQFPVIFGCDVIYETQNHYPILGLLETMLARDGQCWISDPGRYHADAFLALLADSPFSARHQTLVREPYPGRPDGTTNLWVLTWK